MAELRIGTAERESALASLGEHFAQGRLTKEEYDERSDAVWTSRTASDLHPLFADLPSGSPVAPTPAWGPPPAAQQGRGDARDRARRAWGGLPTGAQVVLAVLLALLVLAHLPLVLVAGLVWFVLARHGVGRPPWAHRSYGGCGGARRR